MHSCACEYAFTHTEEKARMSAQQAHTHQRGTGGKCKMKEPAFDRQLRRRQSHKSKGAAQDDQRRTYKQS
eukprot:6186575-Pleurochrysis_carterae.AAC.1